MLPDSFYINNLYSTLRSEGAVLMRDNDQDHIK